MCHKCTKLCKFFETVCTLNAQNCVYSLKNVYVKYIKLLHIFKICVCWIYIIVYIFKKMWTLNLQNSKHSLINCVCWIYKIVFFFFFFKIFVHVLNFLLYLKNCIIWIYRIIYLLWKIVYIEYNELSMFFGKLFTLNIENCIYFL